MQSRRRFLYSHITWLNRSWHCQLPPQWTSDLGRKERSQLNSAKWVPQVGKREQRRTLSRVFSWRVIWRKRRENGEKREACRLGGTLGVDSGPIINWQGSVRLDDHQVGQADMTRGQSRHTTTWHYLPPKPPSLPFLSLSSIPQAIPSVSVVRRLSIRRADKSGSSAKHSQTG